jgi:GNAT superfamily N-acetyltransferase
MRVTPRAADIAIPFLPFLDALESDHWIETLRDGTSVLIRPLTQKDREREVDFINRLLHRSRKMRFFGSLRSQHARTIDSLMNIDYESQMAFVALVYDNGELREVGISRYSATSDGTRCECAVTVDAQWQNHGLGVLLMRHLIEVARRKGFRKMFSIDASDNQRMRDLASYLGFSRRSYPNDTALVVHSLDLI